MADITDPPTRSRMMASIRGKDTKPELQVRRALHARGFRYRLHRKDLPGKPDLVFPRYRAIILVHGCFWHQHGCSNSVMPSTRQDFWRAKLAANVERDGRVENELASLGWRVATVWECQIRQAVRSGSDQLFADLAQWLEAGARNGE